MNLIDGTLIAQKITLKIKEAVASIKGRKPGLAFILVGNNPSSQSYIRAKKKKCAEVGIVSFDYEFSETISEKELIEQIEMLNKNPAIDGILLQLPLPEHIDPMRATEAIDPEKDVDGFHPLNVGKLYLGRKDTFIPCTPLGVHILLKEAQVPLSGQHVVIVGRSSIVGKPLAALLMQKEPYCNATVTVAHSMTKNLDAVCASADVLIAAIGHPLFIQPHMVKKGAVVIDVGINRVEGRIVGDVDFAKVAPLCKAITPVPKGVGPMTIAMLLSNTLLSYERR
ncbi:MAG: bifunctional protein folD [Chlamydiota bacterium]|jgi:methylenetetrahydrofolate dehydrogenase (NADP+)/methenyltetrahydrofolate cyclohydrolase